MDFRWWCVGVLVIGCVDPATDGRAATVDASGADAAPSDGAVPGDGGMPDGRGADGAAPDADGPDGGPAPDAATPDGAVAHAGTVIPDTAQTFCFDLRTAVNCPRAGAFSGQDAQYAGASPRYRDNGDGTVTDERTGLAWTKGFVLTAWGEAAALAAAADTGGHDDWRVPTIEELYSLMDFRGNTGTGQLDGLQAPEDAVPYLDTDAFDFEYGQVNRFIDAQYVTSTVYESTVMGGQEAFFGVNFADGRIKGYPTVRPGVDYYVRFVRGRPDYGDHRFVDNGDGTVTDEATELTWTKGDNGHHGVGHEVHGGLDWEDALNWCEGLDLADQTDWRLPNVKELQHLVDYSRSPDTTGSAAIDPVFDVTPITVEDGSEDFPFYWSSTSHVEGNAEKAAYVAFGQAFGFFEDPRTGNVSFLDVHGAGCQRSDPKAGDPADYPQGHGPQGDVIRIYNFVRCVRGGATRTEDTSPASDWTGGGGGETGGGPMACEQQADCEGPGACPPEFPMGCTCARTPMGMQCVPACAEDADCPAGRMGEALVCRGGFCRPGM